MDRVIKFKAKRLDNNEWIEGDLVHYNGNKVGIQYYNDIGDGKYVQVIHQVDSRTICQFTGLKDKNGKEIWEHDLMTGKPIGSGILEIRYNRGCFKLMAMEGDTEYFELPHVPLDKKGNLTEFNVMCSKFDRKEEKCQH